MGAKNGGLVRRKEEEEERGKGRGKCCVVVSNFP